MNWKRWIGWVAVGIGALLIVILVGGYVYLKTDSFKKFAAREIAKQADQATGGKTTVGGLELSLSSLTANLYDITLRGTESPAQPPLLHADQLTVRAKIISLLHLKFGLRELLIDHPVVHLQVGQGGSNNLPTRPPSKSNSHTSVFDLAIGHAQLTNGEVDYNDRKTPMNADLYDLGTGIRFTPGVKKYEGMLSYDRGQLRYANYRPLPHSLALKFSATPQQLDQSATLRVGRSDISLQAQVSD